MNAYFSTSDFEDSTLEDSLCDELNGMEIGNSYGKTEQQKYSRYASNRKWCVDCYNRVDEECDMCFQGRSEIEAELNTEIHEHTINNKQYSVDDATFYLNELRQMGFVEYIRTYNRPFLGLLVNLGVQLNESCHLCRFERYGNWLFPKDECRRCKDGRERVQCELWSMIESISTQNKTSTSKQLRYLHRDVNAIAKRLGVLIQYGYAAYLNYYNLMDGVVMNKHIPKRISYIPMSKDC